MPETRRIENFGIMKLTPAERGSTNLRIQTDVIQLPYSEYLNVRSNPSKGHYGYAAFMDGEYVIDLIDIQFRRQILLDRDRYLIQLAWQEFCNSKTIATQLGAPLPDTVVNYPIWTCKEIRFKLEPGVILNIHKTNIPPVTCAGTGIVEPDLTGVPPGLPPSPASPPPPSTPEQNKLPLSPPYVGDNDNGNTFVRPAGSIFKQGSGVYSVTTFNQTPSFGGPTTQAFLISSNPADLPRYSVGGRCGGTLPGDTEQSGIITLKDGKFDACGSDTKAKVVSVRFVAN